MQIQNLLTLLLFLVGTTTYAQDAAVKNDLFKCRSYFNTTVTPGNQDVAKADAYCKSIMSATVFCAEQELIKTMAKVSLTQDQITAFRAQYQNKCATASTASAAGAAQSGQLTYAQGAQQAQLQQAQAAAAAAAAAKQNQANSAQQQADSKANLQQGVQLLGAAANIAEKVENAYDKAAKGATPKDAGKVETAPDAQKASGQAAASPGGGSGTGSTGADGLTTSPGQGATASGGSGTAAVVAKPAESLPDIDKMSPAELKEYSTKVQAETKQIQDSMAPKVDATGKEVPAVAGEAKKVGEASAQGGDVPEQKSEITTTSEAKTQELTAAIQKSLTTLGNTYSTNSTNSAPFEQTWMAIEKARTDAQTYGAESKKTCTSLTEKTEFLCMEGTSPGAVAAKTLVNAAGPVLAAVNSAQKACSNTSKITGLAGMGLTVAKGVCMASQAACLGACGLALTKYQGQVTAMKASALSALTSDVTAAESLCASLESAVATAAQGVKCFVEVKAKVAATKVALGEIEVASKKEAAPTPGTSAGLSAKCKMKVTDIIMMAANIGSLMMAKKNADECDKKLSSTGVAGGGATVAQYCEKPENTSTQFCKCQKTPSAEGCPGFTASTSTVDQAKEDQKGLDVKGLAGGKAMFAGGTNGNFKPDGTFAGGAAGSTASGDSSLSLESTSASGATGSAAGATAGAPGGPSANGGRASDGSAPEREKKKWDFGSFAASIGGMFGGSKSGSKANGSLSSNQKNAIERKIASDKLSAEISSASGKSNWEKVKQAYLIKENTLLSGQ